MVDINVSSQNAKTQLNALLTTGYEHLSLNETMTFQLYVKSVLPIDGFVYWINSNIANPDDVASINAPMGENFTVKCSVHNKIVINQTAVTNFAANDIVVTTDIPIDSFNVDGEKGMYIGAWEGELFSFSTRNYLYKSAGLYHYEGLNVLPTQRSQIIDDASEISDAQIFTNSLPIWQTLNQYGTLYDAYLIPENLMPPYMTPDVINTKPIGGGYYLNNGTRQQLCQDEVDITLYGYTNQQALEIVDYFVGQALKTQLFGITNIPIIKDEKQFQREISVLAKRKTIHFVVNYYQQSVREIARKMFTQAFVTVTANT